MFKIIILILLGFLIFAGLFMLIRWSLSFIKDTRAKFSLYISLKEADIKKKQKDLINSYGMIEEKSLFVRLDRILKRAAVNPKITPFRYLIITNIIAAAGFLVFLFTFGIFMGILAFILLNIIPYFVIKTKCNINYNKIDKEMISFLSLLSNFANETTDILTLFRKVLPYTNEPIKTPLKEAIVKAAATADIHTALEELKEKVGHEKFVEVITEIEIASKNQANYKTIISEITGSVLTYIKYNDAKKKLLNGNRLQALVLIVSLFISLIFTGNLAQTNIIAVLMSSMTGMILGALVLIALMFLIYTLISPEKRSD